MTVQRKCPMLITVTGPSGTGKDSVITALLDQDQNLRRSITANTRTPRPGEVDGVHYHFMDKERFAAMEAAGEFLEVEKNNWAGNWYGTLKKTVDDYFAQGLDVISDLNFTGVQQLRKTIPAQHFGLLMLPPSRERLEQRLTGRDPQLAEAGRARLQEMMPDLEHLHDPKWVFQHIRDIKGSSYLDYDAVLVNDVLDHTVAEVARLIRNERTARGA